MALEPRFWMIFCPKPRCIKCCYFAIAKVSPRGHIFLIFYICQCHVIFCKTARYLAVLNMPRTPRGKISSHVVIILEKNFHHASRCYVSDVLHRRTSENCVKITVQDCSTLFYTQWVTIYQRACFRSKTFYIVKYFKYAWLYEYVFVEICRAVYIFADPVSKLDANLIVYLQWCYWSHKEKEYPTVAMVSCYMIHEQKFVEGIVPLTSACSTCQREKV